MPLMPSQAVQFMFGFWENSVAAQKFKHKLCLVPKALVTYRFSLNRGKTNKLLSDI